MPRNKRSRVRSLDRRFLKEVPGPVKLQALLKANGITARAFAEKYGIPEQHVSNTINGQRYGEHVRNCLAVELKVARADLDELLGEASAEEEEPAIPATT